VSSSRRAEADALASSRRAEDSAPYLGGAASSSQRAYSLATSAFAASKSLISFGASAEGTSSVTSLLEGIEAKRLTSGDPEYVHLHGVGSDDTPELACGDLVEASRRDLDKL